MTEHDKAAREIADAAIGEWDAEFLLHGKSAPSLVDLIAKHATAALSALATRVERETRERTIEESAAVVAYAKFGDWAFNHFWQDGEPGDVDGGDAQQAAILFGLLKRTSDADAGATHAEGCEWVPEAPADECSCYVPMFGPIRALSGGSK